ncbi:MAG: sialate O-acetylesterase [Parabacteroides sp.]|nr:sialate O-acetylesterase [Parabacteroides sp.]
MIRLFYFSLLFIFFSFSLGAKIQLPSIFSDGMVLQQSTHVKIWGKAKPNSAVEIRCSWEGQSIQLRSNAKGEWNAVLKTPAGGYQAQQITISDGEVFSLNNVLIGEVWLCAGQSNMEMPVRGFQNCPIEGASDLVADAGLYQGKIRIIKMKKSMAATPQEDCPGIWKESVPENAPLFTAVGYTFAIALQKVLDMPVGIVDCTYGGTDIEYWMSEDVTAKYTDISKEEGKATYRSAFISEVYNSMVHPIKGYTLRGTIWYQGENNVSRFQTYQERLTDYIGMWRTKWEQPEMPFYIIEIAPYRYKQDDKSAYLREMQYKVSQTMPHVEYVGTNDLVVSYEANQIHPKEKIALGKRTAWLALEKTYGRDCFFGECPTYKAMRVEGDRVILSFNAAKAGFNLFEGMVGFEVAGEDRVFYPATARIVGTMHLSEIELFSQYVSKPVAVRYCFHDFMLGNVTNVWGKPLIPFRTDTWEYSGK